MGSRISPPAPGWLQKVNFITYSMFNLCNNPKVGYIETALPIAGEIAIKMLELDIRGFVKNLIRPKQLRSQRHGRRGRRGGRRLPGIPEIGDLAAERLDPKRDIRLPDTLGKTSALFLIDDVVERADNLAFIIDSLIDLPYQTILGVLHHDPSKCPGQGALLKRGLVEGITALGGPNQGIICSITEYSDNTHPGTPLVWAPIEGEWACVWEIECQMVGGTDSMANIRLFDLEHNKVVAESPFVAVSRTAKTKITCAGNLEEHGRLVWQATVNASSMAISNQKLFCLRTG